MGGSHDPDPLIAENQRLQRETQRLAAKLRQAETIIEVQKKLSEILGIPLPPSRTTGASHESRRRTCSASRHGSGLPQLGRASGDALSHQRSRPDLPEPRHGPRRHERFAAGAAGRLDVLDSEPFADKAPAEVYAALLDQGQYLCSIRTMYRVLDSEEVRERRDQLRHPTYHKPQLVATAPNQVWSWDITKLLGPAKWTYFHLYVILDIFSRYVVGWMLASRESEHLAERLIRETVVKEGVGTN